MGNRSINQMFSTREIFDAVPSVKESMTKNAMEDLTACLHYSDDWEVMGDGEWEDMYDDPKVEADVSTVLNFWRPERAQCASPGLPVPFPD